MMMALVVPTSGVTLALLGGALSPVSAAPSTSPLHRHPFRNATVKYDYNVHVHRSPRGSKTLATSRSSQKLLTKRSKIQTRRSKDSQRRKSRDELPTREGSKQCLDKKLSKNMDVRYMTNLRSYIDKIRSTYSCDPLECPSLKERLDRHRCEYHPDQKAASRQQQPEQAVGRSSFSQDATQSSRYSAQSPPRDLEVPRTSKDRTTADTSSRGQSADARLPIDHRDMRRSSRDCSPCQPCRISEDGIGRLIGSFARVCRPSRDYSPPTGLKDEGQIDHDPKSNTRRERSISDNRENYYTSTGNTQNERRESLTSDNRDNHYSSKDSPQSERRERSISNNRNNHYAQTKITFADLGNLTISIETKGMNNNNLNDNYNRNTDDIDRPVSNNNNNCGRDCSRPLTKTETHDVLIPFHETNVYTERLKTVVGDWLDKVPLYPNPNVCAIVEKQNIINELTNIIYGLANNINNENYDEMVTEEIDRCLDNLHIWYPGDKRDQKLFKNSLIESLLKKIKSVNNKSRSKLGVKSKNMCTPINSKNARSNHSVRCTVSSQVVCNSNNNSSQALGSKKRKGNCSKREFECEIKDWLSRSDLIRQNKRGLISKKNVVGILMSKLAPYLSQPYDAINKAVLQAKIVDVLDSLPLCISCTKTQRTELIKFSEELATRLLAIQARFEIREDNYRKRSTAYKQNNDSVDDLRNCLVAEIKYCLENTKIQNQKDIEKEILDVVLRNIKTIKSGNSGDVIEDIVKVLQISRNLSVTEMFHITDCILGNVKDIISDGGGHCCKPNRTSVNPTQSGTLSVYTSENEITGPSYASPITSTVKKKHTSTMEDSSHISFDENTYVDKVVDLIKNWLYSLPKSFGVGVNQNFTETIIQDLAKHIMEQITLEQMAPDSKTDKERFWIYFVYRWLYRYQLFEDLNEAELQIKRFVNQLKYITLHRKSKSEERTFKENGTRMQENVSSRDFIILAVDIIQDEIATWINEQPSEIYKNDKNKQSNLAKELAETLGPQLKSKRSSIEISKDITNWMKKVVIPAEKKNIDKMSKNLKERLMKLPQNGSDEKRKDKQRRSTSTDEIPKCCRLRRRSKSTETDILESINDDTADKDNSTNTTNTSDVVDSNENDMDTINDPNKTMKEFILKYMEHNNNVNDTMTRGAFTELLKSELQKLHTPTRKEVYDSLAKYKTDDKFLPQKLDKELHYIKDISDWLKTISVDSSFNTVGNNKRIDFVNNLAKNIAGADEDKSKLGGIIKQYMEQLPIPADKKADILSMAQQLVTKIDGRRNTLNIKSNTSKNTGGESHRNIRDFLDEYIRANGTEIAADGLKLDAWSKRFMDEVNQMILDENPAALTKTKVYDKLANVPLPDTQTVRRFSQEMDHAKDVAEWLKELPVLDSSNDVISKKICDLAEKIADRNQNLTGNLYDSQIDKELRDYISTWLHESPLDKNKDIDMPVVVQQLIDKIDRTSNIKGSNGLQSDRIEDDKPQCCRTRKVRRVSLTQSYKSNGTEEMETVHNNERNVRRTSKNNSNFKSNTLSRSDSTVYTSVSDEDKPQCCKTRTDRKNGNKPECCKTRSNRRSSKTESEEDKDAAATRKRGRGSIIVDTIESWSKDLPIQGENEESIKEIKNDIAKKLFQKIGELNVNPLAFNDDRLYKDKLHDELELQLSKLPESIKFEGNKDDLKTKLLETIIEEKNALNEEAAGGNYKKKLETTIDSSMPNPMQATRAIDPGFEIYKRRLTDMFIIDNFDHSDDSAKLQYEKALQKEVDKYFENAQKRNAIPLTKDQIFHEIYSNMFKVGVPNEHALKSEVEEVKTRCEVDGWFDELPLREPAGVGELLEWDQILATLSKKVHDIEIHEPSDDDKIHKEVMKWLAKLPLKPGEEKNVDDLAKKLETRLKSTADARKCAPFEYTDHAEIKAKAKAKLKESNGGKEKEFTGKAGEKGKKGGKGEKGKTKADGNKDSEKGTGKSKGVLGTSQVAGPSSEGKMWVSQSDQSGENEIAQTGPSEVVIQTVENWCDQLPLPENTPAEKESSKAAKGYLTTKIMMTISELNSNPEAFNNDMLYDRLLDNELDKLMSTLPASNVLQQSKDARKHQLKEAVKCIKPLIKEEKDRYEYKKELKDTINTTMDTPEDMTPQEQRLFENLKDEIVDNFLEYNFNKEDDDGRQVYKKRIHESMSKYLTEVRDEKDSSSLPPDALIRGNQLITELTKVSEPSDAAVRNEIQEIRMRNELDEFFNTLSLPEVNDEKKTIRNKLKTNLAKQLNQIEKSGHTAENDEKMKGEITKCLRMVGKEVSPEKIDGFVNKLKTNEMIRKAPPPKKLENTTNDSRFTGQGSYRQMQGQQMRQSLSMGPPSSFPTFNQMPGGGHPLSYGPVMPGPYQSFAGAGGGQWPSAGQQQQFSQSVPGQYIAQLPPSVHRPTLNGRSPLCPRHEHNVIVVREFPDQTTDVNYSQPAGYSSFQNGVPSSSTPKYPMGQVVEVPVLLNSSPNVQARYSGSPQTTVDNEQYYTLQSSNRAPSVQGGQYNPALTRSFQSNSELWPCGTGQPRRASQSSRAPGCCHTILQSNSGSQPQQQMTDNYSQAASLRPAQFASGVVTPGGIVQPWNSYSSSGSGVQPVQQQIRADVHYPQSGSASPGVPYGSPVRPATSSIEHRSKCCAEPFISSFGPGNQNANMSSGGYHLDAALGHLYQAGAGYPGVSPIQYTGGSAIGGFGGGPGIGGFGNGPVGGNTSMRGFENGPGGGSPGMGGFGGATRGNQGMGGLGTGGMYTQPGYQQGNGLASGSHPGSGPGSENFQGSYSALGVQNHQQIGATQGRNVRKKRKMSCDADLYGESCVCPPRRRRPFCPFPMLQYCDSYDEFVPFCMPQPQCPGFI